MDELRTNRGGDGGGYFGDGSGTGYGVGGGSSGNGTGYGFENDDYAEGDVIAVEEPQ